MHFMRRFMTVGAFVLATLLASGGATAADSPVLDRVLKSGELRVGMSASQPPFNTKSRSGSMIGLEVDLATALAGAMGVKLDIVTKPFADLLPALEAGDVDLVMSGMAITPERTQNFAFVGPYMMSGKSILTKSSTLAAAKATDDINKSGIKLTALKNSTSQRFVENYLPESKLIQVADYDQAVDMIMNGEADALVADMPICVLTIMRFPNEGFVTLSKPLTIEPIGMAVPGNDPMFLNLMDNYVDAMEATGILTALRKKWLEDGSWVAALP